MEEVEDRWRQRGGETEENGRRRDTQIRLKAHVTHPVIQFSINNSSRDATTTAQEEMGL